MKKLFFFILFSIGCFTFSQAQTLNYSIENQSSLDWAFKMGDANGNLVAIPNIPGPSPAILGTFGPLPSFAFPLSFQGYNAATGCSFTDVVSTPVPAASVPVFCWLTSTLAINYNLVETVPFVQYDMILEISN